MTDELSGPRHVMRSIGAVFAGLIVTIILSIGTDVVLVAAGIFPPFSEPKMFTTALLLLATVYRSVYTVVGGYVTAILAPERPMWHALVLGVVGLALGITGAVVMRDVGPAWYPLALIVLALPCAWLGGKLRETKLHAASGA